MAKLAQAIEHFRTLDKEIPAQVIATFLYVASHDDCSKVDLEKALRLSQAQVVAVILIGSVSFID